MLPANELENDDQRFKRPGDAGGRRGRHGDAYRCGSRVGRGERWEAGWSGFTDEDEKRFADPVARPRGLGLGAAPKPSEFMIDAEVAEGGRRRTRTRINSGSGPREAVYRGSGCFASGDIVRIERREGIELDEDLVGRRARCKLPRMQLGRTMLESSRVGRGPVYTCELSRGMHPRNPSARPKSGSAPLRKMPRPKKARKDEPPPKPWLVAGMREVGRDGDPLFRKKGRVLTSC